MTVPVKITLSLALALVALPAAARAQGAPGASDARQGPVSAADIQRLQDDAYAAGNEVSQLRGRDPDVPIGCSIVSTMPARPSSTCGSSCRRKARSTAASSMMSTIWIAGFRREANPGRENRDDWTTNSTPGGYAAPPPPPPSPTEVYGGANPIHEGQRSGGPRHEVPAGQELDVRLEREFRSGTAQVEDRFTATTVVDLYQGNGVLIPAGSIMRGVVELGDQGEPDRAQGRDDGGVRSDHGRRPAAIRFARA